MKKVKIESNEFVFYLTTKQKDTVDENLKKIVKGNFNMRKYKYYYFLHVINVNGAFGKYDRTYISSTRLHYLFKDWTLISNISNNLIAWGIVELVTKQYYNEDTGEARCSSYAIREKYKGVMDCKLFISYYDKHCRFVKKLIANRHKDISDYNELELNIYTNLQKLTVIAPPEIIDNSIMLHKLSIGDYNISTWSTGRIGYEFTNVERTNRKYLRLDGRPLIEVDICNCQVLLATILFKRYFENVEMPEDLNRLIKVCENGQFYEQIMTYLNVKPAEREVIKERFFEIFFAPNYSTDSRVLKAFKALYPEVSIALYNIKKTYYKNFAKDIQKIESKIIFNVYQQLIDLGRSALTIHDSIVVSNEEDADLVHKLISDEFNLNFGLTPKLKTKKYDSVADDNYPNLNLGDAA